MTKNPSDLLHERLTKLPLIRLIGLLLYAVLQLWGWILLAFAWCVTSVLLSIRSGNWEWFARSGAVVALVGAWLSGRAMWHNARSASANPNWIGGGNLEVARGKIVSWNDDGKVTLQYDEETHRRWAENRREARSAGTGVALALVGTFIWGYGDWFMQWLLGISR